VSTVPAPTVPAVPTTATTSAGGVQAVDDVANVGATGFVNIRVVRNDVDPAGQGLAIAAFSPGVAGGVVSAVGNGILRYAPANAAPGVDHFTYEVRDAQGRTATATVTVTIR
jgi:hypothetical protein